jgi:ATP-dependent DNA helicase RecG
MSAFKPIQASKSLLPKLRVLFDTANPQIRHAALHLPTYAVKAGLYEKISDLEHGMRATIRVRVLRIDQPKSRGAPWTMLCTDGHENALQAVWFYESAVPRVGPGNWIYLYGTVKIKDGGNTDMLHPRWSFRLDGKEINEIECVRPLVYQLQAHSLEMICRKAVDVIADELTAMFPTPLHGFTLRDAIERLQKPDRVEDVEPDGPARTALAAWELLALSLKAGLAQAARARVTQVRPQYVTGEIRRQVQDNFGFAFTEGQERAVEAITADLGNPTRTMLRLIQGPTGCGKTAVMAASLADTVERGQQVAVMVPTTPLARQYADDVFPILEAAGIRCGLLTGSEPKKAQERVRAGIASGEIQFAVGTVSLCASRVMWADLGAIAFDEEHRYGKALKDEFGRGRDVILSSATPIPASLHATVRADVDLTAIRDVPAGRAAVRTVVVPISDLGKVLAEVECRLNAGESLLWVCPLIEPSDAVGLRDATSRCESLQQRFGAAGLLHGKMRQADKAAVLERFRTRETRLLTCTVILEGGMDFPDAAAVVVEHAERFGVGQMAQIKGRVGRRQHIKDPLACFVYTGPLATIAQTRLNILRSTNDVFLLCEQDLSLRGPGSGLRQHGLPAFYAYLPEHHEHLVPEIQERARAILEDDPTLAGSPEMLWLFQFFSTDSNA